MSLSASDWPALNLLLDQALELEPPARAAWIEALGPEHDRLKEPLREILLRGAERVGPRFLETLPRLPDPAAAGGPEPAAVVGPYRLLRELGKGGMGSVWLAERLDGSPARQVALKLPRWSADPALLARRMERERDALASLEHPNIARLYDAGVDAAGRPFLAMEYVDGEPLDRHARARSLPVRARLELFLQVTRAVACAHSRLVVHRDLKPANILVTGDGEVRLLDFGIAKLLDADAEGASLTTEVAGRAFTPEYAAPEQLAGGAITVATDVYALGVVLFELLTGRRPHPPRRSPAGGPWDALAQAQAPRASEVAEPTLRRALRGDLDTILARALKGPPGERYESVSELAQDVRRHLDGLPVLAQPDSRWYRTRKFLGRNRLAVAAASAVVLALGLGLATTIWQARVAIAERDRAEALLSRSSAVMEAMDFIVHRAAEQLDGEALQRLLRSSEEMSRVALRGAPEREALVLLSLEGYQQSANDRTRALALLERAGELLRGSTDHDLLAQVACLKAAWAQATPGATEALQAAVRWARDAGVTPQTRAECLGQASLLAQHGEEPGVGLRFAREAQAALAEVRRPTPQLRGRVLAWLGDAEAFAGDSRSSEAHLEEALQVLDAAGLSETSQALQAHHSVSELHFGMGADGKALPHVEAILRAFGERPPPDVVVANHAFALESMGRHDEALAEYRRAEELGRRSGNRWAQARGTAGTANVLRRLGRLGEARRKVEEAERLVESLDPAAVAVAYTRWVRGLIELDAGRLDEAQRAAERLGRDGAVSLSTYWQAHRARLAALVALARGELEAARAGAGEALQLALRLRGHQPYSSHVGWAQLVVAQVAEKSGRLPDAVVAYREARDHLAQSLGEGQPEALQAAEALRRLGAR